jgi:hypothetical protein
MIAHAPATCGAAMDVPLKFANPPPGTDERIVSPGAKSDRYWFVLLKFETWSACAEVPSVVEATLIAVEMQAGEDNAVVDPSLPDAITVAIPASRS